MYKSKVMKQLKNNICTFKKFDNFFKFMPKDINRYIFSFIQPICSECENCCDICIINCYYIQDCNRGDICCVKELDLLTQKYNEEKLNNSV